MTKYYFLTIAVAIFHADASTQTGAPVYHQHFGKGDRIPTTIGPSLPSGATSYTYSTQTCPPGESYTIMRCVNPVGCFADEWIPLSRDNTRIMDDGNMMIVNNSQHTSSRLIYLDTVDATLCEGIEYEFMFAAINIDKPSQACTSPAFPVFAMHIENTSGQVLFADTTQPLQYADNTFGYKFNGYSRRFLMPAGQNPLVLRIQTLPSSANCAEDFAIDDIIIVPIGPRVHIGFSDASSSVWVKSFCYDENGSVTMSGTMDAHYSLPALQWQQSVDDGITWTDIPGATGNGYSQTFSLPDTFLFRLTGSDASAINNVNCRVVSNIIKVDVDDIPANYTITNNSPLCSGQNLVFNATGGATYSWTGPNGFNETSPFPHIFFSSLADSGMYYVDIVSLGGCIAKDSTYVTMIGTDVHAWPDTTICKGESVQLGASTGTSYMWSPATGLSSTTVARPKATPAVSTVYTVKVTDSFGCSDTATAEIFIPNSVEVKAIIQSEQTLCRTIDSLLFKSVSTGKINSWHWDFGNGTQSDKENPPMQYFEIPATTTNYPVRLTIRDTSGCADSIIKVIDVASNCYIAVPTAFTPNNDGKNDFLAPLNAFKAKDLLFQVFARNGQLVFETRDWTRKWDGKIGGVEQATGVYVWMLTYKDPLNKQIFLKGTSLLIR